MFSAYADLNKVEELITNDEFVQFLLQHTTNIGDAAFVLETVKNKIKELRESEDNSDEI